ncbi:MAG: flagellin hook IN motif-containing protein [Dehalococcoidia bacterium]
MASGVTKTGALLSNAGFVTPLSQSAGSFKVNGVEIAYDSATDSLSTVLSRINNSTAGVTASYDGINDKISFVSRTTGSVAIQFADVTGNFLGTIGVSAAAPDTGQERPHPGRYRRRQRDVPQHLEHGQRRRVQGVTLTLLKERQLDTVTVGQDYGATDRARMLVRAVQQRA